MGPVIGINVGQKRDPTAICVAETQQLSRGTTSDVHYWVRHLERVSLGTPYPEIARRIRTVVASVHQRAGQAPQVCVDATGVGAPLLDQLRAQTGSPDKIYAVQFVHGRKRRVGPSSIRLGKAYFVNRLLSLIQTRRIHLPKTREAQALAQELLNYDVRVNENGRPLRRLPGRHAR